MCVHILSTKYKFLFNLGYKITKINQNVSSSQLVSVVTPLTSDEEVQ